MVKTRPNQIKPENLEEKIVWYTILGTYVLYFMGAQYVWIPMISWGLSYYLFKKLWHQTEHTPEQEKIRIPYSVWIWIVAMLIMELCTIMSHIDLDMGIPKIVTSTIQWARTWALMGLLPLIGCLSIRPQLIYRASCIFCLENIFFAIVANLMNLVKFRLEYLSPIWIFLRGDPQPYAIGLYGFDGESGQFRLNLFTTSANSLGIVGCVYFLIAMQESDKKWRWIGMISSAMMVYSSGSRSTTLFLIVVPIISWILANFSWPLQIATGIASCVGGMYAPMIINALDTFYYNTFQGTKGGSARVRKQLKEIAIYRWENYAPIWGHGVVAEKGPASVTYKPIGTHEQWSDLLYIKGIVGFTAFLFAISWSFMDLLVKAQNNATSKAALSILLLLFICTFAADIEMAAYVYWPGLVILGMGFQAKELEKTKENIQHLVEV